jgi:hypothetical protein
MDRKAVEPVDLDVYNVPWMKMAAAMADGCPSIVSSALAPSSRGFS